MHLADCYALAARLGWMPSYPTFDRNPLELTAEAEAAGLAPADYVVRELKAGRLRFAAEDPGRARQLPARADALAREPARLVEQGARVLPPLRARRRGRGDPQRGGGPEHRPRDVVWRDEAPIGKFDLFTTIDFRMNGSALYSDVVLPAATWYEKHDLSSTDLHPFVHSFNPAIPPPWETRTDFDVFKRIAESFTRLAETHLGVRQDLVAAPLLHDTPDELAQPLGKVLDWKAGECEPIPGKTMPKLVVVERDYGAVLDKWLALGPLVEELGTATKGIGWKPLAEVEELRRRNGEVDGRPSLARDVDWCEAILALSGVTNGRLALEGFRALEQRAGVPLADLAAEHADVRIAFGDTQVQPRKVIASPEWSGMESRERRYSPFTINVERRLPWRTLTGRQQFYVDHEWLLEFGEGLPVYRPPIDVLRHVGEQFSGDAGRAEVHIRWLSPHSKWSIHSEFQDNLTMLTLFRGGPVTWLSVEDAQAIGVRDNDWVEVFNRNGVIACRAVVSHRIPKGVGLMYHSQDRHVNVPQDGALRDARRHRQLGDADLDQADAADRRLRAALLRLQLLRPDGPQRDELAVVRKLREVEY